MRYIHTYQGIILAGSKLQALVKAWEQGQCTGMFHLASPLFQPEDGGKRSREEDAFYCSKGNHTLPKCCLYEDKEHNTEWTTCKQSGFERLTVLDAIHLSAQSAFLLTQGTVRRILKVL